MDRLVLKGAALLLVAAASLCAWGADVGLIQPDPTGLQSADAPGRSVPLEEAEISITTYNGVVRMRANAVDVAGPTRREVRASMTLSGSSGQLIRFVAGSLPDPYATAALSESRPGAVVERVGKAMALRIPGVFDGLEQADTGALPAPGMHIVDLPPGADAPLGMPEPMTLYRVTVVPAGARR